MTKFFFKFKETYFWPTLCPFPQFLEQKKFLPNTLALSHTTSQGFLVPCKNSEKNYPIPRKHPDRWQGRRNDRLYFKESFQLLLGV